MSLLRVGIVCDLREEGWHSMDLVADMLLDHLPAVAGDIQATRLCPPMRRRWSRLPLVGTGSRAHLADRLTARLWDYPQWIAARRREFDVFHIIDHSYAHLVRALPAGRAIVTCHDIDALQAALPGPRRRVDSGRILAANLLDGLGRAAHVACVTHATRDALLAAGAVEPGRVSVVYVGVHPSCVSSNGQIGAPDDAGDRAQTHILHVGSTIPRKRIDVLLEVFAGIRRHVADARLVRVGGALTDSQRALAAKLGVLDAIVEMPFVDRPALAALYRRASIVLLPSDREGFGLPLVEAMACGTPVVASAIPALREIGGDAATYCAPGNVAEWITAVSDLLRERQTAPHLWNARQQKAVAAARRFSWTTYAAAMSKLYRSVAS